MTALETVQQYYQSFNQKDWAGMIALLDENIRHEPNQGEPRIGISLFEAFMKNMDDAYEENLSDMVFFSEPTNKRISVEFIVNGIYKKGEEGFPEAHGQTYQLPAAAFLEVNEGKITRITTYYNLPLWIQLVS
jgi:steroid delta-isomerase-like uncharacterized protein